MSDSSQNSAFVSGFDYDVFVSYAHVDNIKAAHSQPESGWVYTLKDNLESLLPHKIGQKAKARIWIDRRLTGNDPFPKKIQDAVRKSATLLVVMSSNYLNSDWCRQEREQFIKAAKTMEHSKGRIFVVRQTDVGQESWPESFKEKLGYQFYYQKREDDPARTLGWPIANPENDQDRPYFQRLDDLARELANTLNQMRSAQPTLTNDAPKKVFLAEGTPDLSELRENVKRHLEQKGIGVLPSTYYSRAPKEFRESMECDLAICRVFVQLLGPYTTPQTSDLPNGYEGLQLDIAFDMGVDILRWQDPVLDHTALQSSKLHKRASVHVATFEEFKDEIIKMSQVQKERPVRVTKDHPYVLINAESSDFDLAADIANILENQEVGPDTIGEDESLAELVKNEALHVHAALLVYGKCDEAWVKKRVRECRAVMLARKDQAPVFGVYIGPPDGKPPFPTRPPNIHFFQNLSEPAFEKFLEALKTRAGQ